MSSVGSRLVDVFPISTSAFGLRPGWFEAFVPRLVQPAYLLMALMLVASVGILTLKQFENANLERKIWNLPIIILAVGIWPFLVMGLKDLVDAFNTFLIQDVFRIPWQGFGFPSMGTMSQVVGWSAEGLARLLPNLAYWLVYAFYIIFFFFFAVLGPLILAKGILFDEIECLLELVREIATLFLWQTTIVILVGFIMPDIVSGKPFPIHPQSNFYFLSLILGVMIFFAPSMTRKFGVHLGSSFFPPGTKMGAALLSLSAIGKVGSVGLNAIPFGKDIHWQGWKHTVLRAEEFRSRYTEGRHTEKLENENKEAKHEIFDPHGGGPGHEEVDPGLGHSTQKSDHLLELSKKASHEMRGGEGEGEA